MHALSSTDRSIFLTSLEDRKLTRGALATVVADGLGLSSDSVRGQINNWVDGRSSLPTYLAVELEKAAGCSLNTLLLPQNKAFSFYKIPGLDPWKVRDLPDGWEANYATWLPGLQIRSPGRSWLILLGESSNSRTTVIIVEHAYLNDVKIEVKAKIQSIEVGSWLQKHFNNIIAHGGERADVVGIDTATMEEA